MDKILEEFQVVQMNDVTVDAIGEHVVSDDARAAKHCVVKHSEELRWMTLFSPIISLKQHHGNQSVTYFKFKFESFGRFLKSSFSCTYAT